MSERNIMEITKVDDAAVVSFVRQSIGSAAGVEEITDQLRRFVTEQKPPKVVVDFTGVKFFSSMMLGLLVDVWKRMRKYGGRLLISGIDPQLTRVFRITNLDTIFEFAPDRNAALSKLNG
ncbi:MAG: STAS domain-containing protein [Sedimentisphaerales bacterium]|nr:STAS domain-containing protein [Sedimentisphaerales bacterium]